MRLDELVDRLQDGTKLQKEARLADLIGDHIEIAGSISDIDKRSLKLNNYDSDCGYEVREVLSRLTLAFDPDRFRTELLTYSTGEDVRIIAKLVSGSLGSEMRLSFELASITKVGTTYRSRQEAAAKRKASRERWEFAGGLMGVLYFGYLIPVLTFRTVLAAQPIHLSRTTTIMMYTPVANWLMFLLALFSDATRGSFISAFVAWLVTGGLVYLTIKLSYRH